MGGEAAEVIKDPCAMGFGALGFVFWRVGGSGVSGVQVLQFRVQGFGLKGRWASGVER